MLTINIYLRFALIAASFIGGGILTYFFGFWYALLFFLIGIALLVGYVLLGTVQSAGAIMQSGDMAAAEERLSMTKFPNLLYSANKAIFYIMKGTFATQRKDYTEGEKYLNMAKDINLNTDDEKAMVELQLAGIHASKQKWNAAKVHIRACKKLDIKTPQIKEQLQQMEMMMSQRGQMKHMHTMGRKGFRQKKSR